MDTHTTDEQPSSAPVTSSPSTSEQQQSASSGSNTPPVDVSTPSSTPPPADNHTKTPPPSGPTVSSGKSGLSLPILIGFLIFSFLGGLIVAGWYFQTQLQKFTGNATATQTVPTVQPATASKTLVIGTDATAPPMESVNKQGGIVGYDIDLGYRIANELGKKAEFKNIPWDNIFGELEKGNIDMIISSVTITDERKGKYGFSEPYINAGQVIVSRKDNPITTTAQLKGKRISVQKGTTCETEALKYTDPSLVISYDKFIDAATAVSKGTTDATLCDLTLMKGFIDQYDNLKITSDPFTNEYYGVVVKKNNTQLLKQVDDALAVLRVKGILTDLKQKWLE